MILAVDDDFLVLEHIRTTLEGGGWEVVTFDAPEDALAWAKDHEPELVISDIRMPEMDGFEFREAFQKIRPGTDTPFVFMSSMSDDETVVQGLESGADDYLVKPVSGPVLVAKIRSILRNKVRVRRLYHGDLSNLPLAHVLRFCEVKGLTGFVTVEHDGVTERIDLEAGQLTEKAASKLDDLLLLESGRFTICSVPVDLSNIPETSSLDQPARGASSPAPDMSEPMGKLSQLRAGSRRFQIQTEIVHRPERAVVTLVTVDGRSVSKRSTPAPETLERDVLEKLISHQHDEVEQDLKTRLEAAASKGTQPAKQKESQAPSPPEPPAKQASPEEQFEQLFDQGFELARDGKLEEAIATWERAQKLDPFNKVLKVNLETIRKKLLKQQGKLDPFA